MRKCFFSLLLIFTLLPLAQESWAQEVAHSSIRGQVLDVDTKAPIPGAVVQVVTVEPVIGGVSRADGSFRVENVPVGRQTLKITSIGYEDLYLRNVVVSSGKEVAIVAELQESLVETEGVTVTTEYDKSRPLNTTATVSARSFSVEETQRYAASFWDPARMAQSFAGVSSADDEGNEIVIRGNSVRGLLWRLEGIEIPNPNHFRNGPGGSGGGISMISNSVLSNSDFLTGAFPAEYGNALSGVFDLRFRRGNSDKREYTLQFGAAGVQASLEGPLFSEGSSYLLNYRYSTLTLFDKIGIKFGGENAIAPEFQDVNFNVNIPTSSVGSFKLWGIGGLSEAGDRAVRDSTAWDSRFDRFEELENYTTGIAGVTHFYVLPNNQTSVKTALNFSYEKDVNREDTLDNNYELHLIERSEFINTNYRGSILLNHKFSPRHVLQGGVIYSSLGYKANDRFLNFQTGAFVTPVQDSGRTGTLQAYGNWQVRPSEQLTLNAGVHYLQLLLNNAHALEPRFGATYRLSPAHAISYGVGLHSRAEPPVVYLARFQDSNDVVSRPNEELGLTRALHNVLAYDWNVSHNFRIKVEAYHQYLFDVPVAADSSYISALNFGSGYTNLKLVNEGTGTNYGLELTAEKFFSDDYYFLATASLFQSKYTSLRDVEWNTTFNGNYVFNLLGGKEFRVGKSGQNRIGANLRVIWRGGYRYVPIDLEASRAEGRTVLDIDHPYEAQAPDYYRIDLGVNYRSNHEGFSWTVSADVQNATNRENPFREFYNPGTGEIGFATYMGILPNINFTIDF
ncbi:MAG: TonB-dependent receptor [Ignavibacteriae bacterium]|nr:TonB-dependent receptor [Ignavibacteriota bacterium]MCB9217506.1 TonB-dependent receptor [Ignavibacteria bacterium]